MVTADTYSTASVFPGGSSALVIVTLIEVVFGRVLSQYIPTEWFKRIVAVAVVAIGILLLWGKL